MKIRFLFFILLQSFNLSLSQSWKDNFFPPSAETAALIKHVDIPINYSTGVIKYDIPIHTIKLKDLSIPITLSYQSSGFKPNDVASDTGLGWDLSGGGKITQNIIGRNDLDVYGFPFNDLNLVNNRDYKLPWPLPSPPTNSSIINQYNDSIKGPNTDYTLFNRITGFKTREYTTGEPGGIDPLDAQPDLFYFSSPSKSGKFFFSDGFITHQIPFSKEKILYTKGGAGVGSSFTITDVGGTRYFYQISSANINHI